MLSDLLNNKLIREIAFAIFFINVSTELIAQDSLLYSESISIIGRPFGRSIQLRWAPTNSSIWMLANKNGYVIDKFILSKDGALLAVPEKTELTPLPLKPLPQEDWAFNVPRNKYYGIAAQALFGDRFEIDMSKSDAFTIVNKVYEREQRFGFALFAADMSPAVAMASGLSFTDTRIRTGEKYLYRVHVSGSPEYKGSLFISGDDEYLLPKPQNLNGERRGAIISLRWRKSASTKYCAYVIERSTDGKAFVANSDLPFIPLEQSINERPSPYEYATDSVSIDGTYFYRVVGITPFGDSGPPSDILEIGPVPERPNPPHITSALNEDNKTVRIVWEFENQDNRFIKGFHIERSAKPTGPFSLLTLQSPLPATSRSFDDPTPEHINYYKVTAATSTGLSISSPVHLVQLIDSIPPATPSNIRGEIDEAGTIRISWEPNNDTDIFGYRVYRANNREEEFAQLTDEPISQSVFIDKIPLNTLNEGVEYRVMAIDKNQNHSELSHPIRISLPDKLPPQPVTFLPPVNGDDKIILSWRPSASIDVVQYELFEKVSGKNEWRRLTIIDVNKDSLYTQTIYPSRVGEPVTYTVIAVDRAGLESAPAGPVSAIVVRRKLAQAIEWKRIQIDEANRRVALEWNLPDGAINSLQLLRSLGDNMFVNYKVLNGDAKEFFEVIEPGREYRYRLMAVFNDGTKSAISEVAIVKY